MPVSISDDDFTSERSFSPFSCVSVSLAPGISLPAISVLLIFTLVYSSTIVTFGCEGMPFSMVNFTDSVTAYPSGACVSSSVYVPSGSPLSTTGLSDDTHETDWSLISISESELTVARLLLSSIVSFRNAPGISFPETFVLLISTSESSSTIVILLFSESTVLSSGPGTVAAEDETTPSSMSNSTEPVIVYPSGAAISSSK